VLPHAYTPPLSVHASEWLCPAATEITLPCSSRGSDSASTHAGNPIDGGASFPRPHCDASFLPNAHTSPLFVTHSVW
jgi:hypothetical protein